MSFAPFVRLWIWSSAFASLAGWTLSALGQLNAAGYLAAFAAFALFIFYFRRLLEFTPAAESWRLGKFLRRFRRPLPAGFAAFAVLILLGGALYAPTHYTAVAYHIPRVLNWLAAGHWHWIHTADGRANFSGCDFEWLLTPLLLFTHSDRLLFLLNLGAFLLLPGLIFSVFTRLGVPVRAAWCWMWLFPTGYIFVLQAGSAGNDAFATVYALAAIDFGCRAWVTRRAGDLWHSLLAVALLTGTKPTSLPLLLPWLLLIFPLLPLLWRRRWPTLAVAAVALVLSFLPIAVANQIYSHDWLGRTPEMQSVQTVQAVHPLTGIAGNLFQLAVQNMAPPFFPFASWWNQHWPELAPRTWPGSFQPGFSQIGELPSEDWAGLGFGLTLLVAVSAVAARFVRRSGTFPSGSNQTIPAEFRRLVLVAVWIALLFFCAKSAMNTPARLIAGYYPLLLPLLLAGGGQSLIVRRGWWRALAGLTLVLALLVLVFSADRPLWPAQTVLSRLAASHPGSRLISRALKVYQVYSRRSDPLADVRALLPPNLAVVGFIGMGDDPDLSFWRPYGARRVEDFRLTDPPSLLRQQVQYVVLGSVNLQDKGVTLDDWLQKNGAELVATTNVTLKVSEGPQPWYVVRLKP